MIFPEARQEKLFYTLKRKGASHPGWDDRLAGVSVIIPAGEGRKGGRDYRFIDLIFPMEPRRPSFPRLSADKPNKRTNSRFPRRWKAFKSSGGVTGHRLTYRMSGVSSRKESVLRFSLSLSHTFFSCFKRFDGRPFLRNEGWPTRERNGGGMTGNKKVRRLVEGSMDILRGDGKIYGRWRGNVSKAESDKLMEYFPFIFLVE